MVRRDDILQKQWERVDATFRADGTADKSCRGLGSLGKGPSRDVVLEQSSCISEPKFLDTTNKVLIKYIRGTLHRKGMLLPRTLPRTRASWEQLVPQPRQWEVDGSTDPIVDSGS